MMTYLWVHGLLSLGVILVLRLWEGAPPRMRMWIAILGMATWLLPMPLYRPVIERTQTFMPVAVAPMASDLLVPTVEAPPQAVETTSVRAISIPWLSWLFGLCLFIGSLKWLIERVKHFRLLRRLKQTSRPWFDSVGEDLAEIHATIQIIPGSGAMTAGIKKPVIWVGENHVGQPEFNALVLHEWQHIKHGDNGLVLGIHLLECLFWWNPLVRYLGKKCRFYMELACDQTCLESMGLRNYQLALATTLQQKLFNSQQFKILNAVQGTQNTHVLRIKLLERQFQMKRQHLFSLCSLLAVGTIALACPQIKTVPVLEDPPTVTKTLPVQVAPVQTPQNPSSETQASPLSTATMPPKAVVAELPALPLTIAQTEPLPVISLVAEAGTTIPKPKLLGVVETGTTSPQPQLPKVAQTAPTNPRPEILAAETTSPKAVLASPKQTKPAVAELPSLARTGPRAEPLPNLAEVPKASPVPEKAPAAMDILPKSERNLPSPSSLESPKGAFSISKPSIRELQAPSATSIPSLSGAQLSGVEGIPRVGEEHVKAPKIRYRVKPKFTIKQKRTYSDFLVLVDAVVGINGRVEEIVNIEYLQKDASELDGAIRKAMKKWRFKPGSYRGQPSPVVARVVFIYPLAFWGIPDMPKPR